VQGKKGEESAKAEAEADLRRKWKTAGQHSTVSLLTRAGFGPWQRLMTQSRLDLARALNYREDTLLQVRHTIFTPFVKYIINTHTCHFSFIVFSRQLTIEPIY